MERRCCLKAVFATILHAMIWNSLIQMGWSQVPLQENDSDCGLFLLHYIRKFVESAPKTMKMSDVNRLEDSGLVSFLSNTSNQYSSLSTAHSWTRAGRNHASLLVIFYWSISVSEILNVFSSNAIPSSVCSCPISMRPKDVKESKMYVWAAPIFIIRTILLDMGLQLESDIV